MGRVYCFISQENVVMQIEKIGAHKLSIEIISPYKDKPMLLTEEDHDDLLKTIEAVIRDK